MTVIVLVLHGQIIMLLHKYIVQKKPHNILELGSGKTTLVMAHALALLNKEDPKIKRKLYSYEAIRKFYENIKKIIPFKYFAHVDLIYSERRETFWRETVYGFHYSQLPRVPFDMVFVDGPTEYRDAEAIKKGEKGVCLDLFYLLEAQQNHPIDVIVDRKLNSLQVYQSLLPKRLVKFDPIMDVGVIPKLQGNMLEKEVKNKLLLAGSAWRALNMVGNYKS